MGYLASARSRREEDCLYQRQIHTKDGFVPPQAKDHFLGPLAATQSLDKWTLDQAILTDSRGENNIHLGAGPSLAGLSPLVHQISSRRETPLGP